MPESGLSYCQIIVGRVMTGLIGLSEILQAFSQEKVPADAPGLGQRLVEELKKHNYVPSSAMAVYEAALLREYKKYLQARQSGQAGHLWRDPRKEHKPWYPTLFAEKCDGCGDCVPVCPHHVLGWDGEGEERRVLVLEPYECSPGCELCAKACKRHAIVMPPKAILYQRVDTPSAPTKCSSCSMTGCDSCKE